MGRDAGFIALNAGIGGGAEMVLLPETLSDMAEIKKRIQSVMTGQARSSIVVVAEGDETGGAQMVAEQLGADPAFAGIDLRVCIPGHTQRGGTPTARDGARRAPGGQPLPGDGTARRGEPATRYVHPPGRGRG